MNRALQYILNKVLQEKAKKGRSTMTTETTTQNNKKSKYDKFKIAYGAILRGYLESGEAEKYVITNIKVREWIGVLCFFKKQKYIVDFKLGDTIETACDLGIVGFNLDNVKADEKYGKQYLEYGNGVIRNMKKEMEATEPEEVTEEVA